MSSISTIPLDDIPKSTNEGRWRDNFNIRRILNTGWESFKSEGKELFTFHPQEWLNAFRRNPKYPLFVLGDIDGFVALFMNNLATLFGVILALKVVFEADLIYGKIIPG
jgi:hypothetical protein